MLLHHSLSSGLWSTYYLKFLFSFFFFFPLFPFMNKNNKLLWYQTLLKSLKATRQKVYVLKLSRYERVAYFQMSLPFISSLFLSSASLKLGIKILFEKIWATCNNFSPVFVKVKHLRTQFTSLLFLYLKWKQEVFFYSEADYLQKIFSIWKWHWRGGEYFSYLIEFLLSFENI